MFLGMFMTLEGSLVYVVIWHCDFCRPLLYFCCFENLYYMYYLYYMHIFLITVTILNLENISICKRFQACKERGKAGRGEGIHYYSYKQSFSLCGLKVMTFSNDCKFLYFRTACLLTCLFPWKRSLTFGLFFIIAAVGKVFSMTYIYRVLIKNWSVT